MSLPTLLSAVSARFARTVYFGIRGAVEDELLVAPFIDSQEVNSP